MAAIFTRRQMSLASLAALSGCSDLRLSPYYKTIGTAFSRAPRGFDRSAADRIPYATFAGWFDGQPRALLVLATINGDGTLDWATATRQSVSTYGPFVVQALGLEVDLRATQFGDGWATDLRRMTGKAAERAVSYQADRRVEVLFRSTFAEDGIEEVEIYGVRRRLLKFVERVSNDGILRHVNRYWVDPADGFCWKSKQRFIPTALPFNIEILRQPLIPKA